MTNAQIEKIGNEIVEALKDLTQDQQIKVLKAACILLDVKDVFVTKVDIVD